jgi:hypothetical protein
LCAQIALAWSRLRAVVWKSALGRKAGRYYATLTQPPPLAKPHSLYGLPWFGYFAGTEKSSRRSFSTWVEWVLLKPRHLERKWPVAEIGTGRLFFQWAAINTVTLYLVGREDPQFPAVAVPQLLQPECPLLTQSGHLPFMSFAVQLTLCPVSLGANPCCNPFENRHSPELWDRGDATALQSKQQTGHSAKPQARSAEARQRD